MMDPYDIAAERLLPGRVDAINRFWEAFQRGAEELDAIFSSGNAQIERVSEIMAPLKEVSPDLAWEFGPADKGHRLCVTAEWKDEYRALARAVVRMAPELELFEVHDFRDGNDAEMLEVNFEARFRQKLRLEAIDVRRGKDNKIAMVGTGRGSDDALGNQVFGVAGYLLGEQVDRDWFGDVDTQGRSTGLKGLFGRAETVTLDVDRFVEEFWEAVEDAKAARPEKPYWEQDPRSGPYTLIKVTGLQDWTGRSDLMVFTSRSESYADAALNGSRFASVNHSGFGEWFCFVKIPRSEEFGTLDHREDLEDVLSDALCREELGGVVAAGFGQENLYIDVAVTDIAAAARVIAENMRDNPSFADTTLHFVEAGLAEEGFPLPSFLVRPN